MTASIKSANRIPPASFAFRCRTLFFSFVVRGIVYLAEFRVGGAETRGVVRLRRVRGRTTSCVTILLSGALVTTVHLPAFGARAPQSPESATTQPGAQSSPSQNRASQNPTPPGTTPQRPTQPVPPSSQYPPPSAQEPEPPIKDPMIRPAPRPEVAPPSLSIRRME